MSETPSARKDAAGGDDALAMFACPNPECDAFNRFGAGNLSVCERIGKDRHIRRLYCSHCQQRFSERQGSLMQETKLPEPAVVRIIKCLGHGCSVEATADICSVDPRTVERMLGKAGPRAEDFHRLQLDTLQRHPEAVAFDELHGRVDGQDRPPAKKGATNPTALATTGVRGVGGWVGHGSTRPWR